MRIAGGRGVVTAPFKPGFAIWTKFLPLEAAERTT